MHFMNSILPDDERIVHYMGSTSDVNLRQIVRDMGLQIKATKTKNFFYETVAVVGSAGGMLAVRVSLNRGRNRCHI